MWEHTEGVKGFIVAYRTIFAPSGTMNPVNKEQRVRLIHLAEICSESYGYSGCDYGNSETGSINKDNINRLYQSVIKNIFV